MANLCDQLLDLGFIIFQSDLNLLEAHLKVLDLMQTLRCEVVKVRQFLREFAIYWLLDGRLAPKLVLSLLLLAKDFLLYLLKRLSNHGLCVIPEAEGFIAEV